MAASYMEPGVVYVNNTPYCGICDIGRYPAGRDDVDTAFAADLEAASIHSDACEDIMARKYAKLLSNLTNGLEAASGRGSLASPLAERARAEAQTVYAAAGIMASQRSDPRSGSITMAPVEGVTRVGGSTMQSLTRGAGLLEVDDLNGEIVLLGRLYGVPTPVNAMLQRLAVRLVTERIAPGSVPLAELQRSE
jgi:2-dehydropantoate 2-reductase